MYRYEGGLRRSDLRNRTGQVMTADELCGLLRIRKSTLYRLINFPYFRIGTDYR
jgi:hypothetical protein